MAADEVQIGKHKVLDELFEMKKSTFTGVLIFTWVISLLALIANLFLWPRGLKPWLIWMLFTPLNWGIHRLARRHFQPATWIWVGTLTLLLVWFIPWSDTPDLGPAPYAFILLVVVSGLIISRSATLYVAGLATVLSALALGLTGHVTLAGAAAIAPPLVMTWFTMAMSWVSSDQLVTAFAWTRGAQLQAYVQAEKMLESRNALRKSLLIRDNLHEQLQEAHEKVVERALQLETVAEVSRRITSVLDLEQLLTQVTDLICDRLGHYYTGVFLLDEAAGELVLRAAGGERGPTVLEHGLRLRLDRDSVNGTAAVTGQIQCINNVTMWPQFQPFELLPETTSELAVPLHIGERVVGTLDVQSKHYSAFSQDDVAAMNGLGTQVAIAIQNAELYQGELSRRRLAENLYDVGRALTSTLNPNEVFDLILKHLAAMVPFDRASVMLQSGDEMEIVAARGFPETANPLQVRISIEESEQDVFRQIYSTQRPLVVADAAERAIWQNIQGVPQARAWLGVPLIHRDEVIGMLSITRETPNAYSDEDATLAATFAGQAAIALQNARLYERITRFNQELEEKVQERTQALQEAYDQLERMDRTKSDFISVSSHELRTPLTILQGYSQMLLQDSGVQENPFYHQMVTGIEKGAVRMHDIVNSMLDVAKIDSRALDLYPEPLSIPFLLEPIQDKFARALAERSISLMIEDMRDLPAIEADPEALYKVFYHLVGNAIKYTPDGGTITISGRALDGSGDVLMDEGIEIVVSDTGIGIDPENQELIFEKFYQTGEVSLHSSGTTKFKGGGPGLGLAIARGIVEAHQGKIWVESPGCDEQTCPGSQFHLVLPLRQGGEQAD